MGRQHLGNGATPSEDGWRDTHKRGAKVVRSVISASAFAIALLLATLGSAAMPAAAAVQASSDSPNPTAAPGQAAQLVTQEELCAFRAPLLLNADTVPITCLPVVEWLRRVINADMQCGDLWLQRGAVPDCALPYR
jgi:hypothetical protein